MHATEVLKVTLERNLQMISETIDFLRQSGFKRVFYDAEHFFDGYRENPEYALQTLEAARKADCIILCDTNGGSMPPEVHSITKRVSGAVRNPLGIHSHNDSGLALANSLAALDFARHVQGTINGLGERCGNLDLCEFIPIVQLKMGMKAVERLEGLKELSRYVERLTGFSIPKNKPFVGENAFRHKAGVHVDGIMKNHRSYEHILPEAVGNERLFTISEQAGRSNVLVAARKFGYELDKNDSRVARILEEVKRRRIFSEAELFILLSREIDKKPEPFELLDYRTSVSKDGTAEASVELRVGKEVLHEISRGVGPVHSLDLTIRKALKRFFDIEKVRLTNYRVRILNEERATAATVEVLIEFRANGESWYTIASSDDVIKASGEALVNGYKYYLLKQSK
jgi:2-isopropylmalate synthase